MTIYERRDGAALAGALLEEMDRVSITGIFATHLHELFDLPLQTSTLSHKRMGIDWVRGWVVGCVNSASSLFSLSLCASCCEAA